MTRSHAAELAIFGSSDGVVACTGVVLAEAAHGPAAVIAAAIGLLIAEGLGMAASEWLADEDMSVSEAALMGVSTALPIAFVAAPWLLARGSVALSASLGMAVLVGVLVALERRGGARGWAETFGVLGVVAVLSWVGGLL